MSYLGGGNGDQSIVDSMARVWRTTSGFASHQTSPSIFKTARRVGLDALARQIIIDTEEHFRPERIAQNGQRLHCA